MNFKEQVKALLDAGLQTRPDLFVVDLDISADQRIRLVLDGDRGVTLDDCIQMSRAIEHNLDRETTDFALEVSSAGANSPLTLPRQYPKNIGRKLKVKTAEGTIEAELIAADEQGITLSWTSREPKKIGKGKETVTHQLQLSFDQIHEAKVLITF